MSKVLRGYAKGKDGTVILIGTHYFAKAGFIDGWASLCGEL
jgi:hypothetical protein